MNIGVIGCGYVFDTYMNTIKRHSGLNIVAVSDVDKSRLAVVGRHFGYRTYDTNEQLLADPEVKIVLNLTSIDSHYEVTKAALLAGKHVYSEKPFATELDQARELMSLAAERGLRISGAPCNPMSNAVQTLWRAIRDGAVGKVLLVYGEIDDSPIYLMNPETWSNPTGAPWPYKHEYEAGCTFEHAGYYLGWLAAMFGPAKSMTAFSKCLVTKKTETPLDPADTPDFSVACIEFQSGVTARLTCGIVAPFDQRLRVVGDEGELSMNTYRDYDCPVRLERFSALTLNARKSRWVREYALLGRIFGVGGANVRHLQGPTTPTRLSRWKNPIRAFKNAQLGTQDKCMGLAEMADAVETGRAPWLTPEFMLHVTEMTLAMQRAGVSGTCYELQSTFTPLAPLPFADESVPFPLNLRPALAARLAEPILRRLHKH